MCKIDQIHSGTACAAPADMMEQAIEQAAAHVSDVSPSNQIDGKTSWDGYVRDPRPSGRSGRQVNRGILGFASTISGSFPEMGPVAKVKRKSPGLADGAHSQLLLLRERGAPVEVVYAGEGTPLIIASECGL